MSVSGLVWPSAIYTRDAGAALQLNARGPWPTDWRETRPAAPPPTSNGPPLMGGVLRVLPLQQPRAILWSSARQTKLYHLVENKQPCWVIGGAHMIFFRGWYKIIKSNCFHTNLPFCKKSIFWTFHVILSNSFLFFCYYYFFVGPTGRVPLITYIDIKKKICCMGRGRVTQLTGREKDGSMM